MNFWSVIGSGGFIAPRHIQAIRAIGDDILLTCDINKDVDAHYTDWRQMMRDSRWQQVSHVAICTPNDLHFEMANTIGGKGKWQENKIVLCEKPLVITSDQLKNLSSNVFTVLQLRYHPEVIRLKLELNTNQPHHVKLLVRVKRDDSYWTGWKGEERRSGGILFNLGIHYFDLLIYLFGKQYEVTRSTYSDKLAEGTIRFDNCIVDYRIEINGHSDGQTRSLEIDGVEVSLSKQDNLSFENLHTKVYEDIKNGRGVQALDALPSIVLVEKLKNV